MSSIQEPPTLNIGSSFIVEIAPGYSIEFVISDIDIRMDYESVDVSELSRKNYLPARREFTATLTGINVQ